MSRWFSRLNECDIFIGEIIELLRLFFHVHGRSPSIWAILARDLTLDLTIGGGSGLIASVIRGVVARPMLRKAGFVLLGRHARIIRPETISVGAWVWVKEGVTLFGSVSLIVGDRVVFCERATIWSGIDGVVIGDNVWIGMNTYLAGTGGRLIIGDHTLISDFCSIYTVDHNIGSLDVPINEQGGKSRPVTIGAHVLIGSGARILPGVTIGDHAIVGAGSVVTRDVEQRSVVAGVPARVVRTRDS
jgi:acetyltransferase-like isoleucine patch superfamily enzyme